MKKNGKKKEEKDNINGGHREVPHHLVYVPPLYIY